MSVNMSDRNNFLWRPNDNSSTTLTRYRLEAQHWSNAFKSIEISKASNNGAILIISLIIQIIFVLIQLVLALITDVLKWLEKRENRKLEEIKKEQRERYIEKLKILELKREEDFKLRYTNKVHHRKL